MTDGGEEDEVVLPCVVGHAMDGRAPHNGRDWARRAPMASVEDISVASSFDFGAAGDEAATAAQGKDGENEFAGPKEFTQSIR